MSPIVKVEKHLKLNTESHIENAPRLFVGGLDLETTDNKFEAYFSQFGTLTEARITKRDSDSKSRGFGFVTFSDEAELDACQRARPHFVEGTNVSTFRYVTKEEDKKNMSYMDAPRGHCKKLYVSELDQAVTEDDLNCYFGQYGNITDIELKLGNSQNNTRWKGNFAFIEFDDYDPVDKCIMDGHHKVDGKTVIVRRALAKHGKDFERKVFVGPLTDELTDEMLYNYYKKFGKLTRIERPLDKRTRKRKDFAFMEFCSMDPVEKIVQCETHDIEGHELRVKKVGPKDWSQSKPATPMFNNPSVWNQANFSPVGMFNQSALAMAGLTPGFGAFYHGFPLPTQGYGMPLGRSFGALKPSRAQGRFNPYAKEADVQVPEHVLLRYFSNFGNVIKIECPWDGKNNRKRDYAFVEFDNTNSARMCMMCPSHQIMGHNIIVREGSSKGEPNMDRKIFVDLKGKSRAVKV